MNATLAEVIDRGGVPTRQDVADVLVSVGKPGTKQEQKRAAIEELFGALGGGRNTQGHSVVDALDSWPEY